MADNITVTQGTGTTIRTDDVSGVHYQVIKVALGADGALDALLDSGQQTSANSLPVVIASDQAWATSAASHLYGTMAAGSITGSYQAVLTDSNNKIYVNLYNGTNSDILVSFNGTNDHDILPPGTALVYNLGALKKHIATNVSIKYSGTAPSTGTFYCSAKY